MKRETVAGGSFKRSIVFSTQLFCSGRPYARKKNSRHAQQMHPKSVEQTLPVGLGENKRLLSRFDTRAKPRAHFNNFTPHQHTCRAARCARAAAQTTKEIKNCGIGRFRCCLNVPNKISTNVRNKPDIRCLQAS
jgi:hypothetical protein